MGNTAERSRGGIAENSMKSGSFWASGQDSFVAVPRTANILESWSICPFPWKRTSLVWRDANIHPRDQISVGGP